MHKILNKFILYFATSVWSSYIWALPPGCTSGAGTSGNPWIFPEQGIDSYYFVTDQWNHYYLPFDDISDSYAGKYFQLDPAAVTPNNFAMNYFNGAGVPTKWMGNNREARLLIRDITVYTNSSQIAIMVDNNPYAASYCWMISNAFVGTNAAGGDFVQFNPTAGSRNPVYDSFDQNSTSLYSSTGAYGGNQVSAAPTSAPVATTLADLVLGNDATVSGNIFVNASNNDLLLRARVWDGGGTFSNCNFETSSAGGHYVRIEIIPENNKYLDYSTYYSDQNLRMSVAGVSSFPISFDSCNLGDGNLTLKAIPSGLTVNMVRGTFVNKTVNCGDNVTLNLDFGPKVTAGGYTTISSSVVGSGNLIVNMATPSVAPGSSISGNLSAVNVLDFMMNGRGGDTSSVNGSVTGGDNSRLYMPLSGVANKNNSALGSLNYGNSAQVYMSQLCQVFGAVTLGTNSTLVLGPTGGTVTRTVSGNNYTLTLGPGAAIDVPTIGGAVTVGGGSTVQMNYTSLFSNTLTTAANGGLTLTMNDSSKIQGSGATGVSTGTGPLSLTMNVTDATKGITNNVVGGNSSSITMTNASPITGTVNLGSTSSINMSNTALISGAVTTGNVLNLTMTVTDNTKGLGSTLTAGNNSILALSNSSTIAGAVTLGDTSTATLNNNSWFKSNLTTGANNNLTLNMNDSSLISGAVTTGTNMHLNMAITDNTYALGIHNTLTAGNNAVVSMTNFSPINGLVTLGNVASVSMSANSLMNAGLTTGGSPVGVQSYTTIALSNSAKINGNVTIGAEDSHNLTAQVVNFNMINNSQVTGNISADSYNILSLNNNAIITGTISSPGVPADDYLTLKINDSAVVNGAVSSGNYFVLNMNITDITDTKGIQNTVTALDYATVTMNSFSPISGLVTLGKVANVAMSANSLMANGLNAGGSPVGVANYTTIALSNSAHINNNVTIQAENSTNLTDQVANFSMVNNALLTGNISVDKYNILSLNDSSQVVGNMDGNLNGNNAAHVIVKFGDIAPINYVTQGQIDYIEQVIIYPSSSLTLNHLVTGTEGFYMYQNTTLNINVNMTAGIDGIGLASGTNRVVNIGPGTPTNLVNAGSINAVDYINVVNNSDFNTINSVDLTKQFFVQNGSKANILNGISGSANILNNGDLTLSSNAYIRGSIVSEPSAPGNHSSLTIKGTILTSATSLTVEDVFAFSVTDPSNYDSIYIAGPIDMSQTVFKPTLNFTGLGSSSYDFHIARGRQDTVAQVADNQVFANLNTLFSQFVIKGLGPDVVLSFERIGFGLVASEPYLKEVGFELDALSLDSDKTPEQLALLELIESSKTVPELDNKLAQLMSINTVPVGNVAFHPLAFQQIEWRMVPGSQSKAYSSGILGSDYSLWVKPFYSMSRQKSNSKMTAFKTRTQGIVLGLDNNADTKDTIGVAASILKSKLTGYAGYDASARTSGYELLTYGQYTAHKEYYWEWIGMFSLNVTDQTRNISFPGFSGVARSNYSWMHGAAKLGLGKDFIINDYTIWNNLWHWKGDFMYSFSYEEIGAGAANLKVKPQNIFSVETGLTSNLSYALEIYDVKFVNVVEAAVTYKVINPKFSTNCSFVMGSEDFVINMRQPRFSTSLSARLQIHLTDSFAVGVDYKHEFNSAYKNNTLNFSVRYDF